MKTTSSLLLVASLATVMLAGCHINSNKNGKNDNVDIGTPFGSMQVKTNDNVDAASTGLTPYPGASVLKGEDNSDAADLNLNFGKIHIGVKALSYQTGDSTDKVIAFYRKDLARYGDIIQCHNDSPIGEATHTSQGLTCHDNGKKMSLAGFADSDDETQLRSGSQSHQHIVVVKPKNGGTRIGLVMLDLPADLTNDHDDKQSE